MSKISESIAKIARTRLSLVWFLVLGAVFAAALIPARWLGRQKTIEAFSKIYYATQPYANTTFLGIRSMQFPTDNWVMQEIITEVNPDFIIETGTAFGGTTLFYATVLDSINEKGKVLTMNIAPYLPDPKVQQYRVWRERVEFTQESSLSPNLFNAIAQRVRGAKVLITLDSGHHADYVLSELRLYAPLVSVGSYIVVQDTHLGGHPNHHESEGDDGGPWAAVAAFMKTETNFVADHSREKYLVTQYPSGFLKRIR
jgi:cephalosporin hydroxylase